MGMRVTRLHRSGRQSWAASTGQSQRSRLGSVDKEGRKGIPWWQRGEIYVGWDQGTSNRDREAWVNHEHTLRHLLFGGAYCSCK